MILGNRYPASLSRKHLWDPERERGRERREGWAERGTGGACLTSATVKTKTGKERACERGEKIPPFELHYCSGKEREEERREGSGGKRGEDNGVNASGQAAAALGLITHTLCLSGERTRCEACI